MTVNSSALLLLATFSRTQDRSAWNHGVTAHALDLLDAFIDASATELERSALLNGASSWAEYSHGGSALIYDSDIAKRLCTPSELKRKRGDELPPNSRERDPPRVCGENAPRWLQKAALQELPPRVRGKENYA